MELKVKKSLSIQDYKNLVDKDHPKDQTLSSNEQNIYQNLGKYEHLYGSDIKGSLFKKDSKFPWNLQSLPGTL